MSSRTLPLVLALLALACDDTGSAPDDITSACRREAECAALPDDGASPERECRERLTSEYDEAAGYGCGAAYSDWVSCLATTRGQCPDPADAEVDPCQGTQDAFLACQAGATR